MKTSQYTSEDVERWREAYAAAAERTIARIRNGTTDAGLELTDLARRHEYLALTAVALRDYARARGHFGASGEAYANVFERSARGNEIDASLAAIVPPGAVLLAEAGTSESVRRLIAATGGVAAKDVKGNASHFLGVVLRLFSTGEGDRARALLGEPPKMPKHQESSLRAVRALGAGDERAFVAALKDEVAFWEKTIKREQLQRHPDAVCFAHGLGWIALAEKVWQRRVDVQIEHIPIEVLRSEAEQVDVGV